MARRIRFEVAQPIIIIGWYTASILLIGLVIAMGVMMNNTKHEHPAWIYSQGYYYGVYAAALYFIIASLLVVTAWGAYKDHYRREYKLTNSQRTLMLQTIIFCVYLLGGAAVYAKIEGWRFLDALYWADFTLLTIGVGNFAPMTHLGRGLLFPYGVGGIVILGLVISSIRTLMLEHGKQQMDSVLTARTRRFFVKEAFSDHNHLRGLVPHLGSEEIQDDRERQKREFITMRRVRQLATVEHKWMSLAISAVLWMAMWLLGAVVFWRSESYFHWSYFEALYFAYVTLLTIGYGDLFPESSLGKSFFVFWSLLAVPTITILISNIGDTLIHFMKDVTLFLGEITILPGDKPWHERFMDLFRFSWTEKWLQETTGERDDPQDLLDATESTGAGNGNGTSNGKKAIPDRTALEAAEHQREVSAHARGDIAAENEHHYNYLLFREVRKLMELAAQNVSKEFDYLEWEYYLALLAGKHRPRGNETEAEGAGEREAAVRDWSWIDKNNPLLGEKSEVQWLLEALTEALEVELKKASRVYTDRVNGDGDGNGVGDQGLGSSEQ